MPCVPFGGWRVLYAAHSGDLEGAHKEVRSDESDTNWYVRRVVANKRREWRMNIVRCSLLSDTLTQRLVQATLTHARC